MTSVRAIEPLAEPPDATIAVPGSKSLTNRALICAALAEGESTIEGALLADDTDAMVGCLNALGVTAVVDPAGPSIRVVGRAGVLPPGPSVLDARLSGTTARFVLPLVALGHGDYTVDGLPPLRARPMGPTIDALRALGATVEERVHAGHLPVTVRANGLVGGTTRVRADTSSQFLTGLLLSGPAMDEGVRLELSTALVARPFLDLTVSVMDGFGVRVDTAGGAYEVPHAVYAAARFAVEPDASAASYFLAAAAICGGRVRIEGLGAASIQGDTRFAQVLGAMGARVAQGDDWTEVTGTTELHGIDVDLSDMPDMAQTLAAVAVFADSPTTVRGVDFIRGHETDRITAVVTELTRCGITARESADGFVIEPGTPRAARIETYHDHRMAMSFALLGLRVPGIEIADPDSVAKTFPGYFAALDGLR
jgi:3-phosphoshikimate 1-carboxyvinyltransferase